MTDDNGTNPNTDPAAQAPAALDLDTLEREGGSPIPFVFQLSGRRYLLADPKELDWQDLVSGLTNPYIFFKISLPPDDQQEFFKTKLPSWKLNHLIEQYIKHYGLPQVGESDALPR
jgi:hypothetical protein